VKLFFANVLFSVGKVLGAIPVAVLWSLDNAPAPERGHPGRWFCGQDARAPGHPRNAPPFCQWEPPTGQNMHFSREIRLIVPIVAVGGRGCTGENVHDTRVLLAFRQLFRWQNASSPKKSFGPLAFSPYLSENSYTHKYEWNRSRTNDPRILRFRHR